ncbi:MAG: hypothetical protein H6744_13495 [Deltaproteobacteria bacterium]|nr:hypothetical protein [Deltaproteobacteria bacterium]
MITAQQPRRQSAAPEQDSAADKDAGPESARSKLRGMDYEQGAQALAPAPASPAPPEAAAAGPIGAQLPSNVSLEAVRVSAQLGANRTLTGSWQYEVRTQYATTLQISVSRDGVFISASPSLDIDAQWPVANMRLYGAGVRFADGRSYSSMRTVRGLTNGMIDLTGKANASITALIDQSIAGTAMARPGYDPMTDPDLMATLGRISANFQNLPTAGGQVGVEDLGSPSVGATLKMQSPFEAGAGKAGVSIAAGTALDVDISGSGDISALLRQSTAQGAAEAAHIQRVSVRSEGVILTKDGKPIARLQSLSVSPSGAVTLERFELMGDASTAGGFESLLRLLGGAIRGAQYGSAELGMRQTAITGGADPTIVRGLTKSAIEEGMSEAVRKLLNENKNAIPGMDLARVFGGA